ncbi:hypothetical protein QPK87_23360 [Kamptonema cortianum]|nr:hypothetical protein [Kamptonema cortianum]MDL5044565.1 hypothetical protein [Oscillatoria amoena NRMC-F 0135]
MSGLKQTPAAFNHHRVFLYQAFQQIGVDGQRIAFNPMSGIKTMKGKNPDRKRPSWEQFKAIIADVRSQKYNASVQESGDYLEAMGRLGLGNAELNKMTWGDINFATNEIHVLRKKTVTGFIIPIYPQAKDFLLGLKAKAGNPSPDDKVFSIKSAKKALAQSCARLGLPSYTHISLRRCFISRCLELGIDVQSVAGWQGHQDGGKLILSTYGNVGSHHRQRMAAMLTDETPDNIVSIEKGAANA